MSLSAIIDREFRSLESQGKGPFPTVQSQAAYFEMEQTYLSKLRSQSQSLSRAKAQLMASKLRTGQPASKVVELVEEMLQTSRPFTKFEEELANWFEERAASNAIMIVEFLEPPIVGPHGFRPDLGKIVGAAVAKGLKYAMLLPVNMDTIKDQPSAIIGYFMTLQDHLTETYRHILERALDEKIVELAAKPEISKPKKEKALDEVASRLRLYALNQGVWPACPALGVRLFYTEHPESTKGDSAATESTLGQLWKWVSAKNPEQTRHEILHKEATRELIRATTIRYTPILDYWREKAELPQTSDELKLFVEQFVDPAPHKSTVELLAGRWSVVEPPQNILRKAKSQV
jgi:hypothetical protein